MSQEYGSTLGFYLQRSDLHILEGRSSNLWYGSFFPDAPHRYFSTKFWDTAWKDIASGEKPKGKRSPRR